MRGVAIVSRCPVVILHLATFVVVQLADLEKSGSTGALGPVETMRKPAGSKRLVRI